MSGLLNWFFILASLAFATENSNYTFFSYLPSDGLPQSQVSVVFQDNDGYIWFGTYSGLGRFNGRESIIIDSTTGLPNNSIMDMTQDAQGRYFIATYGGGLTIYHKGSFSTIRNEDGSLDYINDLYLDSTGRLWLATYEGLFSYKDGSLSRYPELAEKKHTYYCIYESAEGQLFFGTESGVLERTGSAFRSYPVGGKTKDCPYIYTICQDADGNLLAGTEMGIYLLEKDKTERWASSGLIKEHDTVNHLIRHDTVVWAATGAGVLRYEGGTFSTITEKNGLTSNYVNNITVDSAGDIWFATNYGATRMTESPFHILSEENRLIDNEVVAMYQGEDNGIWLATASGAMKLENGEITRQLTKEDGFQTGYIMSISGTSPEEIYLIDYYGLYRWDGETLTSIYTEFYPTLVFCDSQDRVWLGSGYGLYQLIDDKVVQINPEGELGDTAINYITEDPLGRLWCATANDGILIWDGTREHQIATADGFTSQDVWCIDFDQQGNAWAGTNGDGLFRISSDGITRHTTRSHGLSNNFVWQVLCAPDGTVWLNTNMGLDLFDGEVIAYFNEADGMAAREGIAGCCIVGPQGRLWFGSDRGISIIDPGSVPQSQPTFPIYVEAIEVNGTPVDQLRGARLAPEQNRLTFHYAALTYTDQAKLKYQYRLEGEQENWSEYTREISVTFAGLAPGDYSFNVRATVNNGKDWHYVEAPVAFSIAHPFYQTWPFILLMLLLLLALIYAAYRWRTRLITIRNRELEAQVAARTASLHAALRDLKEINLTIQEKNEDLRTFNAAVGHDLRAPIQRIRSYAELLEDTLENENRDGREFLLRINDNCETAKKLLQQLLNLYTASSHELDWQRINVSALAKECAMNSEADRKNKNISFKIEDSVYLTSDPQLLSIVIANLMDNAVKYSSVVDSPEVSFGVQEIDGGDLLFIADNGVGFPDGTEEKIFEMFNRQHSTRTFQGFGIGLATARRIVDKLGGRIWAENQENNGAIFYIDLNTPIEKE